jgi:hypothetical protein
MPAVDNSLLERWRSLDAAIVVRTLADYAKPDPTYVPVKARHSQRWHANVRGRDFELLLTGPKFWDTRLDVGGGGAIDLTMHLAGVDFKGAVRLLKQLEL